MIAWLFASAGNDFSPANPKAGGMKASGSPLAFDFVIHLQPVDGRIAVVLFMFAPCSRAAWPRAMPRGGVPGVERVPPCGQRRERLVPATDVAEAFDGQPAAHGGRHEGADREVGDREPLADDPRFALRADRRARPRSARSSASPRAMKAGSGAPRPSTSFEFFSNVTMPHDSASQCALSQASQRTTSAWPRRSAGHRPRSGRFDAR